MTTTQQQTVDESLDASLDLIISEAKAAELPPALTASEETPTPVVLDPDSPAEASVEPTAAQSDEELLAAVVLPTAKAAAIHTDGDATIVMTSPPAAEPPPSEITQKTGPHPDLLHAAPSAARSPVSRSLRRLAGVVLAGAAVGALLVAMTGRKKEDAAPLPSLALPPPPRPVRMPAIAPLPAPPPPAATAAAPAPVEPEPDHPAPAAAQPPRAAHKAARTASAGAKRAHRGRRGFVDPFGK